MEDPENATTAYEQALTLDTKDPAIPLNYAIMLHNQGMTQEAQAKLSSFEERVNNLRKASGLDADPDVSRLTIKLLIHPAIALLCIMELAYHIIFTRVIVTTCWAC